MVQMTSDLERGMTLRIPGYVKIRQNVSDIVSEMSSPRIWLDTGCGNGGLVRDVYQSFPSTQFVLADPSSDMIASAKITMSGKINCAYVTKPTDELNFGDSTLDIITAMFCHHYYSAEGRKKAIENCFRMLKPNGAFIYTEHVKFDDEDNKHAEWKEFMINSGLPEPFADEMLSRSGREYFPISEADHVFLLKECGFSKIDRFWLSCSDIGFIAIK